MKRTSAVLGLVASGLLLGGGVASADPGPAPTPPIYDIEPQNGLLNLQDLQAVIPIQACNNNVPVNVLGVQVPVLDNSGLPILSGGNTNVNNEPCNQDTDADND